MAKITKQQLSDGLLDYIASNKGSNIAFEKKSVVIPDATNRVFIGIQGYNKKTDLLMVYKNTVYLEEDRMYSISEDSQYIIIPNGNWDANTLFNFIVIKNSSSGNNNGNGNTNIPNSGNGNFEISDGTISESKLEQNLKEKLNTKKTFANVHFLNSFRDEGCILIQSSNNKNILIDCGESYNSEKLKLKLNALNINTIDYLIITHFHSDHVGGYETLLNNFKVNEVIYREVTWTNLPEVETEWKTTELFNKFIMKCNDLNIMKRKLTSDIILKISDNESLHFYNTTFVNYTDYNSASLMILYNYNNTYCLFTADITKEAIDKYIGIIPKVSCYIMPHHGGWTNTSVEFVQSIRPRISISHGLGLQNSKEYLLTSKWACDSKTYVMNHYHESGVSGFIVNSNGVFICDDIKEFTFANEKFLFDGKYYLIGSDGNLIFEGIHDHKGNLYYIENYEIQIGKGWFKLDDEWYFCQPNGELMRDMWKQSEVPETLNYYYRLGNNGKMIKNTSLVLEGKLIWFDENGVADPPPIEQ